MSGTTEKLGYFGIFRAEVHELGEEPMLDGDNRKYSGDLDGDAFEMWHPNGWGPSDRRVKWSDSAVSKVATIKRCAFSTPLASHTTSEEHVQAGIAAHQRRHGHVQVGPTAHTAVTARTSRASAHTTSEEHVHVGSLHTQPARGRTTQRRAGAERPPRTTLVRTDTADRSRRSRRHAQDPRRAPSCAQARSCVPFGSADR